jgi:hypothetical protein
MSELISSQGKISHMRWRLLATVSVAALVMTISFDHEARASDSSADNAPFWIELGGQLARNDQQENPFDPTFLSITPRPAFETVSPLATQKMAPSSWDGSAKITYEPKGTGWSFSASILYGKSTRDRDTHLVTPELAQSGEGYFAYQVLSSKNSEQHTILDFKAGKDFGLGLFGHDGHSIASLGVRYAQFVTKNDVVIQSQPTNVGFVIPYQRFSGAFSAGRKFSGVGPSLSWDASAGVIGDRASGELALDWGLNAAVLFGRQSAQGQHKTTDEYWFSVYYHYLYKHSAPINRRHNVTVPNIGGFAGVSWRYPNAKVTVGYRADFFFGAMDGGIDAAHRENVGFYGPFASVSVGLGG